MNLLREPPPGPDVPTEVLGWERADAARAQIVYATELFKEGFGEPEVES